MRNRLISGSTTYNDTSTSTSTTTTTTTNAIQVAGCPIKNRRNMISSSAGTLDVNNDNATTVPAIKSSMPTLVTSALHTRTSKLSSHASSSSNNNSHIDSNRNVFTAYGQGNCTGIVNASAIIANNTTADKFALECAYDSPMRTVILPWGVLHCTEQELLKYNTTTNTTTTTTATTATNTTTTGTATGIGNAGEEREEEKYNHDDAQEGLEGKFVHPPPAPTNEDTTTATAIAFDLIHHSIMTSMVISISFIRIAGSLFTRHLDYLNKQNITQLLEVLEVSHWHARSFNEDQTLRTALKAHKFMIFQDAPQRSPNLLVQEVCSITQILKIVLTLLRYDAYLHLASPSNSALTATATATATESNMNTNMLKAHEEYASIGEHWLTSYGSIVCTRYSDLDDTLASSSPISSDLIAAYKASVICVLQALDIYSPAQFLACIHWAVPVLKRLILCHDREIRIYVGDIFQKQVVPLLPHAPTPTNVTTDK